jgi:hypothetical protein
LGLREDGILREFGLEAHIGLIVHCDMMAMRNRSFSPYITGMVRERTGFRFPECWGSRRRKAHMYNTLY